MRKFFLSLAVCLALCTMVLSVSAASYTIMVADGPETIKTTAQLKPFFFVNYLYDDVFIPLKLMDQLTLEDKKDIAKRLFNRLSKDYSLKFTVNGYQGQGSLVIVYRLYEKPEPALLMLTNYSVKTKALIKSDKEQKDVYGIVYYLKGEKLVPPSYVYTKALEDKRKGSMNDLADLYLFDDIDENDALIQDLLQKGTETAADPEEKYITYLTMAQSHLLAGDWDKAAEALANGRAVWEAEIVKDKELYELPYTVTSEQLEILKTW